MLADEILALIRTAPGISHKRVETAFAGVNRNTVGSAIESLRAAGLIETMARGVYRVPEVAEPKPAPARSHPPGSIGGPSLARLMAGR